MFRILYCFYLISDILLGRHKNLNFTGTEGLQINIPHNAEAIDVYRLFLSEDLLEAIATETNRYAHQVINNTTLTRTSRLHKWNDIGTNDLKIFFGIIMWMGLNVRPTLRDYWSTSVLYENKITKLMPRNQFEIILKMLHFSDNTSAPEGDRIFKIRSLIDKLHTNFQNTLTPGEEIVIDETMVPWRGRLSFRQYIPGKKHKYGVKLFKICSTEGFTWKLQVYTGATQNKELGLGERVVLELCEGLYNEGRTLYTDNFYTSVSLARKLLNKDIHLVGTIRKTRKELPKSVINRKLQVDELYGEENDEGIVIMKWKPKKNKEVQMLSTKHGLNTENVIGRKKRRTTDNENENGPQKKKPIAIIEYNKGKCGIDKSDQMASYATCVRKGIKWYRKVAFELLTGVSVVNAYIIYKKVTSKKLTISKFREQLCLSLLGLTNERINKVKVEHLLMKRGGNGTKDRKNCVACYETLKKNMTREEARKKVRRVKTFCNGCPEKPTMCFKCHVEFHKIH